MSTPNGRPASRPRVPHKEQYLSLRALGKDELPAEVLSDRGARYRQIRLFKHDFFAATGMYESVAPDAPVVQAVLKVGRIRDFLGVPMDWLGRHLTLREARAYQMLQGMAGIPAYLGMLPDQSGLLHAYVPGRPLQKRDVVGDAFFDQLSAMLDRIHALNMAYVDLQKRQNILLGDDGLPYLIDFQISYIAKRPNRLLKALQEGDRYHLLKHKHRLRPDLCTPQEKELATHGTRWTRLHRAITQPLQGFRRSTLERIRTAAGEDKGPG